MGILDIIFLVLLLFGGYRGYQKGLLMELISLSSIFLAIIVSMRFMPLVSGMLGKFLPQLEGFIPIISFVIVFVAVLVLLNILGKSVKKVLDLTLLGSLDDILGLVVGLGKVSLVLSFIIWSYNNLLGEMPTEWTTKSVLFPYIQKLAPFLIENLAFLFPYMENIKDKIQNFSGGEEVLSSYKKVICQQNIL